MSEPTEYVARSSGGGTSFDGYVYVKPLGGGRWSETLVTYSQGHYTRAAALHWARAEIKRLRGAP